jgi:AcrR family transcriptional regulator
LLCPSPRPRNAAATRVAILDAARARFAAESYDDVGMRDIARDVGVDAALISRYFGSKEELFSTVLDNCPDGGELMQGDRSQFGRRVAQHIVFEPKRAEKMQALSIMLRSVGSAKASEVVRRSSSTRFYGPFSEWIGGPDAAVKARLASGMIMGMAVSRDITGGYGLTPEGCETLRDRLAVILQSVIDA